MNQRQRLAIGLGSNLGDRLLFLRRAASRLAEDLLEEARCASVYESSPWLGRLQPDYLNTVVVGVTEWKAPAALSFLQDLERELGRVSSEKNGSRIIDLDLLCYGEETWNQPGLRVPHPHLRERDFVMVPLAEVWPDWRDPQTGHTAWELRGALMKLPGGPLRQVSKPLF